MRLGVNGWRIQGLRTGVGRYLANVVRYWSPDMIGGRFSQITFYTPTAIDRRETPLPTTIREQILPPRWPMLVWENLRLAPVAGDDVLFCPSYTRPLLARGRVVVTTHDAVQQLYPQLFPRSVRLFYNRLYGWSARHATLVITDSEAARQDIARCWEVPMSRIRVVYLAPAEFFRPQRGDPRLAAIPRRFLDSPAPFFLFVGKLAGRRNVPLLLEAFAELKRRHSVSHKLLMVGPNTRQIDIRSLVTRLGVAADVTHLDYVSDDDLNLIYNAADAFISPSTYETVSLPVLEAQATGTAVICIDSAGMREITGGAAMLLPRLDVRELVGAMAHLVGDPGARRELSERGLANVRRFSWQRCAAETLDALAQAARLPGRRLNKGLAEVAGDGRA